MSRIKLLSILLLVIGSGCTVKKEEVVDLKTSYFQARTILDNGIKASGGLQKLDSFKAISFDYKGKVGAVFQGHTAEQPHLPLERKGSVSFDVENGNILTSTETNWPNFSQHSDILILKEASYRLDHPSQTYKSIGQQEDIIHTWKRLLPPLLLTHLLKNANTLRYISKTSLGTSEFQVILGQGPDGSLYRFYFSTSDNRLYRVEYMDYFEDFGDTKIAIVYDNYQTFDGIYLPANIKRYDNDDLVKDYYLDNIKVNNQVLINRISLPEDYLKAENVVLSPPEMTTTRLANNLYLIENIARRDYNALFIDFSEYIMVLEAPIGNRASQLVIGEIKKRFPDKPIKYLMITHFHGDHAGGIRAYMQEGASIITTPGNQKYFEEVARQTHSLNAPYFQQGPLTAQFNLVLDKSKVFRENDIEVHFLDMGPTAHVNEILVAYFPEEQLLFQGDLFRMPVKGENPAPARPEGVEFYNKIKAMNLKVKRIIGVHGPVGDIDQLKQAVELSEKN